MIHKTKGRKKESKHRGITIRSYYGNLAIDIWDLIFAFGALLLVWISGKTDNVVFFGISAIVYLFPRLLTLLSGIINNGRDVFRQVVDIICMVAAIASVFIVFVAMANHAINPAGTPFPEILQDAFFVSSGVSLGSSFYRVFVGISQKISLTYRNSK